MKKVLVTGADGFIGRHLIKKLAACEIDTFAVVRHRHIVDRLNLETRYCHQIFIEDLNNICEYDDKFPNDLDVMYHLAWDGVQPEARNDWKRQMNNIALTMQCLNFANKKRVRRVILPGSTSEYLYYGKPLNKDAIPTPSDSYGAVKVALRYLCTQFAQQNNIEFIYTIISGIYAADRRDNNVIFYTISKLLNHEKPSFTKLEQLWDYVYIDDLIDAMIAVAQKGLDGAVYAIGHGDNWPLARYIKIIHEKIAPSIPLGIGEKPYINSKMPMSCVDLTDIKKDTGFSPRIAFEEGIAMVINQAKYEMQMDSVGKDGLKHNEVA